MDALQKFKIIKPHLTESISLSTISNHSNISSSTLKRWIKLYEEKGLLGLERKSRSDKGKRRKINQTIIEVVEALALQKPPLSLAAIHRKAVAIAQRNNWTLPTYYVVHDIIKKIAPDLLKLALEGSKAYSEAYELIYRREAARPNEMWQADHTPLDILLIDEKGEPAIAWLTIIIDDYSRAVSGFYISFGHPCILHTALALRQGIWRKQNTNWQVCGIPEILYTDHGSDFTSKHIEQVCLDLKINLKFSIVGRPQGRGRVERFFKSVNQLLLMQLPGYKPAGSSGVKPTLTLAAFTEIFEKFIIDQYHNEIHSATNQTPIERWTNNGFLPQLPVSLEQLDLLLLTIAKPRKVQRDGIRFNSLRYISTTLAPYVGESIMIRYDPRDISEIRVFYQDKFLCRAVCQELAGETVSLKEIIRTRKRRKKELRQIINERKSLLESLLFVPNPAPQKKKTKTSKTEKSNPSIPLKIYKND